nr:hypothetical protein [Acidimicrobiia bacterium]
VLVTGLDYTGVLDEPREAASTPGGSGSSDPPPTTTVRDDGSDYARFLQGVGRAQCGD